MVLAIGLDKLCALDSLVVKLVGGKSLPTRIWRHLKVFGHLLGASWAYFWRFHALFSWSRPGASSCHLEGILPALGLFWKHLERSWKHLSGAASLREVRHGLLDKQGGRQGRHNNLVKTKNMRVDGLSVARRKKFWR